MEFEWDIICRVCLQEGEMRSIYDKDGENKTFSEKIMQCSNITIKRNMNLPEQICKNCIDDLNVAYKFRLNCESSDAVLQSYLDGNVADAVTVISSTGEYYKYRPPMGLNIKRVKHYVKTEPHTDDNIDNESDLIEEQFDSDDQDIIPDEAADEKFLPIPLLETESNEEISTQSIKSYNSEMKLTIRTQEELLSEQNCELTENANVCTIKPTRSRQSRNSHKKKEKTIKVVSAQSILTQPDGTTLIRVRKNLEDTKPLKICEICGNTYKYKHALESHMRRHRNEKPFSCEICGRSFVINFELRRHMRTHTGQKPYPCRHCGRRFSDFGSRIKHERTHTGERPYKCETCGKCFAYSHVLASHILTHTGEKKHVCDQCGKRFTKSHHLKAHLNTHYKNQKPNPIILNNVTANDVVIHDKIPGVAYDECEKMFEQVLTVLAAQPKIEPFDDTVIEEIHSEDENRHAVTSINIIH